MAMTPDLAPGARQRVWILLGVTVAVGAATYAAFERAEILWLAGVVLLVLVYLLVGVRLTLRFERAALAPVLENALEALAGRAWVVLDAGGVVLHLAPEGEAGLGHPADVLCGQRLADLVPLHDTQARVALRDCATLPEAA